MKQNKPNIFIFNEKVFCIDVKRCFIGPQRLHFQKVNETIVVKIILSFVTNFTMTLGEEILMPFPIDLGDTYIPQKEDEINSSTLNFYILDG